MDTPGLTVVRALPVFGYMDPEGHVELSSRTCRVPATNLIADEGDGFAISQARLGPGRIHHCMRSIGAAERALELLCQRALVRDHVRPAPRRAQRTSWTGSPSPASSLEMVRLLTLKTAWMMDTVGNKAAAVEISAIKVAAPERRPAVIDRAIQVHGAGGLSDDWPLAQMYAASAHAAARRRPRRGAQDDDRPPRVAPPRSRLPHGRPAPIAPGGGRGMTPIGDVAPCCRSNDRLAVPLLVLGRCDRC